jgi:hypothetical protein
MSASQSIAPVAAIDDGYALALAAHGGKITFAKSQPYGFQTVSQVHKTPHQLTAIAHKV